jgi:hypothetical protein
MTEARRLWFPLVAPAAAFGAAGAFGWWMGARICTASSVGAARSLVAVVTAAMIVVAGAALATGLDNYRRARAAAEAAGDRTEFMAMAGVFVSTSLLIGLVWFVLNPVFIDVCGGMR